MSARDEAWQFFHHGSTFPRRRCDCRRKNTTGSERGSDLWDWRADWISTMDLSSGEEVLAGDARWRSAPMATVQLVTGPIFDLYSLSSCDVESSFRLVDVKARFSFRTVTFGFRLKVGMVWLKGWICGRSAPLGELLLVHVLKSHYMEANSSEALLVLTAVQNPTTQFHPSASRSYLYDQPVSTELFRFLA